MNNSLEQLEKEVKEAVIDFFRLNNIRVDTKGEVIYRIGFKEVKEASGKTDHYPALIDPKDNKYTCSVNQLAGMKIVDGDMKSVWFGDFENEAKGRKFQQLIPELKESGVKFEEIKFKCIGALKILNRWASEANAPVYRDVCYSGYNKYAADTRLLREAYPNKEDKQKAEYRNKLWSLTNELRATALLQDKAVEANLELVPVFSIVK